METVITEQSAANAAYVRRLLRQKQPGFAAALEFAVLLADVAWACLRNLGDPPGPEGAGSTC